MINPPALEIQSSNPKNHFRWRNLLGLVVLAVLVHLVLIVFFGTRTQIIPRQVSRVPRLQLAGNNDPLVALGDPTLFALPGPRDFASATWLKIPTVKPPPFGWSEAPRWLSLERATPGATLERLTPAAPQLQTPQEMKPPPPVTAVPAAVGASLPVVSSLIILGALAGRDLVSSLPLPSLPYDDVIPPSRVQALVDQSGQVVSAVFLPSTDSTEATERCADADQRALGIARQLRFAPAPKLELGEIVFNWHTEPVNLTNIPSGP